MKCYLPVAVACLAPLVSAASISPSQGTISGRLLGPDGVPVAGTIECKGFAAGRDQQTLAAGETGQFQIDGVDDGHYRLVGSAPGFGSVEVITCEGDDLVELRLTEAFAVTCTVRTKSAAEALGREPAVQVFAQPQEAFVTGLSSAWTPESKFELADLPKGPTLVYAATDDGWISRRVRVDPSKAGKNQLLNLREGARVEVAALPDALWTYFEIDMGEQILTAFVLGPGQTRTVTVPKGTIDILGAACLGEPQSPPAMNCLGRKVLRVGAGDRVDLTGTDSMAWDRPERRSLIALLILEGDTSLGRDEMSGALAKVVDLVVPAADDEPQESEDTVAFDMANGNIIAASQIKAPVPGLDEAVKTSIFWPKGGASTKGHRSHVVLAINGTSGDAIDLALNLTRAVNAIAKLAGDRALGVLWGGEASASRMDIFQEMTANASREALPLQAWVQFQPLQGDDKKLKGMMTVGLKDFDLMEIEVPPCTTDIDDIFDRIYGIADYLVQSGPVINDGDTIGETNNVRIRVTHSPSLVNEGETVYQIVLK